MLRAAVAVMLGLSAVLVPVAVSAQPSQGQPAEAITIRLSNFAFAPAQLQLRVGVPVRLHLVNDSSGGHSFSAPALFAASAYPSGAPPQEGTVQIAAGGSVDITLVPRAAGTYKLECTHFLHSMFGMTGTIVVAGS
ncbi:MAG TPA: cupredoxin domain-containing protein [Acetobacteraceae bacterium]